MNRGAVLLAACCVAIAAGCGGSASLPEAPPCVAATPTPTVTARSQQGQANAVGFAYYRLLNDGSTKLQALTREFRDRWPDGRFYRQSDFRSDFVAYAGESRCVSGSLAVQPGTTIARFAGLKARVDPIFVDYQATLELGRDAVRTRNVTDYRSFNRRLDELAAALDDALAAYRTAAPAP